MNQDRNYSIVHIHPTLNCNLRCLHCYSNSEPNLKLGLELDDLLPYLKYLRDKHKFNVISISGGEPFLYSKLLDLLKFTKDIGYYNQVVSNGMLLKSKRNRSALDYIDSIAISIDGNKELHNEMRASNLAYDKMLEGIDVLKEQSIPFGLIHTITKKSWRIIPDLIEIANQLGCSLLQLHPIENAGRAEDQLNNDYFLSQDDLHKIFILVSIIRETSNVNIQLDLLHKQFVVDRPEIIFGAVDSYSKVQDLFKEMIITESGDVLPISYGFSSDYLIHNLKNKLNSFDDSIEKFLAMKGRRLQSLLKNTYNMILENEQNDIFNWSEIIVNESRRIV